MALVKIPLRKVSQADIARPWLGVIITNPHTGKRVKVWGIIDTGADECALPAAYAELLGHKLQAGSTKEINTGNGVTIAYSHTIKIETAEFSIKETLIDFMPNLHVPLLGVQSFLSNFILTINYPEGFFTLENK